MARDYGRFLKDDGRLNPRLLPRAVYIEILNRYKRRDDAINAVFDELHWRWDLEKRLTDASATGNERERADVAAEMMAGMNDDDWWPATEAFERHLCDDFRTLAEEWTDVLNPVYDWQDREGWADRHYAQYPVASR